MSELDNFYDAEARKANAEERKEFDRLRKRKTGDMRSLLKIPEFRRFAWDELSETGVFHASFTLNSNQMAFNEGRRDRGLALLARINEADPNAFSQMQREFISEKNSRKEKQDAR